MGGWPSLFLFYFGRAPTPPGGHHTGSGADQIQTDYQWLWPVVWHGPSIPGDLKNPSENASKTHWSIGLSLRRYSSIFSAVNSGILVVPSKFGRLKSRVCQVIRNFPNAESLVWSNPEDHWGDSGHNRRWLLCPAETTQRTQIFCVPVRTQFVPKARAVPDFPRERCSQRNKRENQQKVLKKLMMFWFWII